MNMPCAVEHDLARHLVQLAHDTDRSEAIEKIADESREPGGDCDPFDKDNFVEAIDESPKSYQVRDLLRTGDEAEAGHVLRKLVTGYWREKSLELAETELERRIQGNKEEVAAERWEARNDY